MTTSLDRANEFVRIYNDTLNYPSVEDVAAAVGLSASRVKSWASEIRKRNVAGEPGLHEVISRASPSIQAGIDVKKASRSMTPEEADDVVALYERSGHNAAEAARAAEISVSRFHILLRAARALQNAPEGFSVASISTNLDKEGEIRSQAIRARAGDAGREHEIPEGHKLARLSSLVDDRGRVIQEWRITTPEGKTIEQLAAALRAELEGVTRLAPTPFEGHVDADLLTLYPLPDIHHSLYADAEEAGEDYDLNQSGALFRRQFSRLVSLTPPSETAQILGLGDFFHTDTEDARTPKSGNPLDRSGRQWKSIRTGIPLFRFAVDEALRKHRTVHVAVKAGNHDPMSSIWLAECLAIAYEKEPRVRVSVDPSLFWFARWGRVLLAATHGHTCKPGDFASLMAAECGVAWGESQFRYGFQGHIHHETRLEKGGAIVETLQTISSKDAWHAGQGYVSGRSMVAITFDKEAGEVARNKAPVIPERRPERVLDLAPAAA